MSPFDFLQKTGLATRNFVIFKDPHQRGYRQGISQEIPDWDSLLAWQRRFVRENPHIRDVYCIGVSAGAIPAITAGHQLGVKTVWSFSARSPSERWVSRYGQSRPQTAGIKSMLKGHLKTTARRLRQIANIPAKERFSISMIDVQVISDAAAELREHNGKTEYRLYYASTNATDVYVHQFLADCPGVTSVPILPPVNSPDRFRPGWDHIILPILDEQGKLEQLFPPYAPA